MTGLSKRRLAYHVPFLCVTGAQIKKEVTISCRRDIISNIYRPGYVKNRPKWVNWSAGLHQRRACAATGGILVCFGELY